jgi:hypothetical protein
MSSYAAGGREVADEGGGRRARMRLIVGTATAQQLKHVRTRQHGAELAAGPFFESGRALGSRADEAFGSHG